MNDPWIGLRQFTQARIAQGRAGHGVRTASLLDFQLAHALARDAVHLPWDADGFAQGVQALGLQPLILSTRVADRLQYLKRPDLGRTLDAASRERLAALAGPAIDIALSFSNGLSSAAMESHGLALLRAILEVFRAGIPSESDAGSAVRSGGSGFTPRIGPICVVPNARVGLSDEIGALLRARLSVIVVGERPGLSAADSLGIYMTYNPNPANTDAERNCISNIRPPEGMNCRDAAAKLAYLSGQSFRLCLSGVALKDDMPALKAVQER